MPNISYSQLSVFENCPKQYKLRYVDKLSKNVSNIHLIFGSAMHTVIQSWLDVIYNKTATAADKMDLNTMLKDELISEFLKAQEKDEQAPCTKDQINEFFDDGVAILDFLKRRRGDYFAKKQWSLVGCEIPINVKIRDKIRLIGFLDVVLKHSRGRIKILDLKTSTICWNKYVKSDKLKAAQLLLYKMFYAEQKFVAPQDIDIEFFILKRRLYEKADFPQKRIQKFVPANGSVSLNRARKMLDNFVTSTFDKDGKYIVENLNATPSKKSCKFCEFLDTEDCKDGVKS